jgi:Ca2+-binding EF-hand superfamily protein
VDVTRKHVARLQHLVSHSGLGDVSVEQLFSLFAEATGGSTDEGVMDRHAFKLCLSALLPSTVGAEEQEFLSFALNNIWYAFDRDNNGVVDFEEFASGMSLLASGSKSDKLALAFTMFDEDGDGYISRTEMWKYLRAFLTVLLSLVSDRQVDLYDVLDNAATDVTATVFADADTNRDGRISFEEFGEWYNAGGFRVMPWLELLDLRKWDTAAAAVGRGVEAPEEEEK